MRLILLGRWAGRQLCRLGLHKWGRVREITSLDVRGTSPRPDGGVEVAFWVTGDRYAIKCERPGCQHERDA